MKQPTRLSPPLRRTQRGIVLFVALIVLVAMTLAGLGIVRSMDSGTAVTGNLAFRQSSTQVADIGIQQAFQWVLANHATLNNTNTVAGYYSAQQTPDWYDANTWAAAPALTYASGVGVPADYTVSYIVHRMCTQPNTAHNGSNAGVPNKCGMSTDNVNEGGPVGAPGAEGEFGGLNRVYYRITVRVVGPRNTVSLVQSMVSVPI